MSRVLAVPVLVGAARGARPHHDIGRWLVDDSAGIPVVRNAAAPEAPFEAVRVDLHRHLQDDLGVEHVRLHRIIRGGG